MSVKQTTSPRAISVSSVFLCSSHSTGRNDFRIFEISFRKENSAVRFTDHVYFVHLSTDILVDISTDSRPTYRWTYRPSVNRYVGRHIGRVSVNMSTEICRSTYRPMYWSMSRPTLDRYVGRYVDREWLSDCRPTRRSIGYRHSADTSLLFALVV